VGRVLHNTTRSFTPRPPSRCEGKLPWHFKSFRAGPCDDSVAPSYVHDDADVSRELSAPPPAARRPPPSVPSVSTKGMRAEFHDSHKGREYRVRLLAALTVVSRRLRYVYIRGPTAIISYLLSSACLIPTPSPKSVASSPKDFSRTANRSRFSPRARQYFLRPRGNQTLTRKQKRSNSTYAVKRVDDHYYCKCPVSRLLKKYLDYSLLTGLERPGMDVCRKVSPSRCTNLQAPEGAPWRRGS